MSTLCLVPHLAGQHLGLQEEVVPTGQHTAQHSTAHVKLCFVPHLAGQHLGLQEEAVPAGHDTAQHTACQEWYDARLRQYVRGLLAGTDTAQPTGLPTSAECLVPAIVGARTLCQ